MPLQTGARAPGFTLRDHHGRATSLEALRSERPVLLVFFPFAFSGVCSGEMRDLRDQGHRIDQAGASLVGVSCDPMFSLRTFADQDRLGFPLLSDFWPHGEVARAYDVFDTDNGCPTRSSYLVDRGGAVRWGVHNPMGEARSVDDYVREIEALETLGHA
ncbi:MAG TPA: peroxiredoxin [Nocardioidaceae bacterium]